jgi:hypothetical protein
VGGLQHSVALVLLGAQPQARAVFVTSMILVTRGREDGGCRTHCLLQNTRHLTVTPGVFWFPWKSAILGERAPV